MTTEQLRLEIEVQVKQALANLKQTSAEYKTLAEEAKRAAPAQHELNAAIASLDHDLKTSAAAAKVFGDELGGLKEQQTRLKQGITDLIDRGLAPESAEVQQLKTRYDETTAAIKRHGGGMDELKGKLESALSAAALVATTKKIGDFVGNAVGEFATAQASAQRLDVALQLRGMQSARGSLDALASKLQDLIGVDGDLVSQLEAELIAQGKSRAEVEKTITAAAGLSSVTGGDLASSVAQLTTTYSGQARQLAATIPAIKNLTEEQLKQGAAIDIVASKYTGFIGQTGSTQIAMNRMRQSVGDAVETFGSIFAPTMRLAADVISSVAKALANASPEVKTLAGIITGILFGALVGATIRTVALTLAKWGLFGAEMAVNSAIAVGNPLLWIGIAAAAAAVITVTALVAAKQREAKALSDTATAAKDMAAGYDQASTAMARMSRLKELTDGATHLRAEMAALKKELSSTPAQAPQLNTTGMGLASMSGLAQVRDPRLVRLDELKKKTETTEAEISKLVKERNDETALALLEAQRKAAEERAAIEKEAAERAAEAWRNRLAFRVSTLNEINQAAASAPGADPFDQIELDRQQKIIAALNAGIAQDDILFSQINSLFDQKRAQKTKEISDAEQGTLARITATRLDDLELEKRKALETYQGTEAGRAQLAAYYARQISDVRIEEEAKLTRTQVDDLEAARDRELELFAGTEEQKLAIAQDYARQIADAQIAEQKRAFDESLRAARENKDYGQVANLSAQQQLSGTEVGQMAGLGGAAAVDPITMLIEEFLKLAMQVENVGKLLNPWQVVLESMFDILEPLLNGDLQGMVDVLVEIGATLGQVLSPVVSILGIHLSILAGILRITSIPLKLLGELLVWLNNKIIVPVGNAIIDVINGVINAINWALGWLGVHINTLQHLQTVNLAKQEELNERIDLINDQMDELRDVFDQKKKNLEDAYDKNIGALEDLLRVGAIRLSDYDRMVAAYNSQFESDLSSLEEVEEAQLKALQDILDALNRGEDASVPQPTAEEAIVEMMKKVLHDTLGSWWGFASGTSKVPQDQLAMVHKGEVIVPESFSEGLRSGTLTLGKGGGRSEVTMIDLTVNGSVLTQDDLVTAIAKGLAKKGRRGTLPAEAMN